MSTIGRVALLAVACGTFAAGGFSVSQLRAGSYPRSAVEAIAAAGGQASGLLASAGLSSGDDRYRLSALSVFSNVALHVKDHYVDPERVNPREMLARALEEVEQQIAEVLVEPLDDERIRVEVMGKKKLVVNDVENLWEINLKLRDVFRFFEKHLPPQDDVRLIEYAAVNGALATLDPHSILLKPEAFAEMKTSTKGEFGGLGIVISIRDGRLTIISPIDGTPASRAGLEAGDVISRIGDVSTVSMPVDEAVRLLRGPKGSKVVIWVDRSGWPTARKFSIIRERIKLESVESELLSGNVGYIKIKNFQQNTGKDLEEHLSKLEKESAGKLKGLVLDLRNNPGGLLEQATRVSDKFLSSGDIVTTVGYGNKLREPKRARWSGTETNLPLAVLVNRGSASASEIVAGALKNLDRATIIGETTFGKGSVQVLYDFSDSSALKLTIAQYLTPGDISIQNEGVQPDIALHPAWLQEKGVRMFYENDRHREASLDKHLDRAGRPKAAQSKPSFEFTYLVRESEEEEKGKKEDDGDQSPAEDRPDFPVDFARQYLLKTGSPVRSRSLSSGQRYLRATERSEGRALSKRLAELDVDWSPPPTAKADRASRLSVQLELLDAKSPGVVAAGGEVSLKATVTNAGDTPVFRLHGILASDNPSFEGREMLFGKVLPGESRSWTIYTRVPREESSRTDRVTLALEAEGAEVSAEAEIDVTTEYVPQPQFAFTWLLDDVERGDGDGVLEVGEGVNLDVLVTNVGKGTAEGVSLRLKSAAKKDLFLERGRVRIGQIGPGQTKRGTLKFRVPRQQSGRETLPLELSIFDAQSGEWLEGQFDLRASAPMPARAEKRTGSRKVRQDTTLLRGAQPTAEVIGVAPKGAVLEAEARIGPFVRVRLPSGARAFVRAKRLKKVRSRPSEESAPIVYHAEMRPPRVQLAVDTGKGVVSNDHFRLRGAISARSLRDMYVLLNNDKVYFKRAASAASSGNGKSGEGDKQRGRSVEGWLAPDESEAELPFEVDLDLKEGLNRVVIVGRLNETVMTQRTLFLSRARATAVAEHTAPSQGPASEASAPR